MQNKYSFFKSNRTICDAGEILCFATLPVLNNKKNLEHFLNLTCLDKYEKVGGFSDLHKIFKDFYLVDNDQDGMPPSVYEVINTSTKKKKKTFFVSCSGWHPSDFFENAYKNKKKNYVAKFSIKTSKLVFFCLPDVQNKSCKTQFKKKDIKAFSDDINNFSLNRIELDKFEEFNVINGVYNIYTFWHDEMGGNGIFGHLIELK